MRGVSSPAAVAMADAVDARHLLGMLAKTGTLAAQAANAKETFPEAVVLLHVGENYEAFGVDAVLTVEHAQTNRTRAELRTTFRQERVQAVLNHLLAAGYRIAVYEETAVLVTPRQRVFSQLVSAAQPAYAHAPAAADDASGAETAAPKPIVAVGRRDGDDAWDVAVCDVPVRQVRVYTQVEPAVAEALVASAALPVVCIRAVPPFVAASDAVVLGASAAKSVDDRLVEHVETAHGVARLARVPGCIGSCAPLPRFTTRHLGLVDDGDASTPSLVDACVTLRALAPVRHRMHSWLCTPPAYRHQIAAVVEWLRASSAPLPDLRASRPGRWRALLSAGRIDGIADALVNARAFLALAGEQATDDWNGDGDSEALAEADAGGGGGGGAFRVLAEALAAETRLRLDALDVRGLQRTLDAVLADGADDRARPAACVRRELYAAEQEAVDAAVAARDAMLASYPEGSWTHVQGSTCFFGSHAARGGGPDDRMPFVDAKGRILPDRHCTRASCTADAAVADASAALDARLEDLVAEACRDVLARHEAEVHVVDTWALAVATLVDHVRAVGGRWNPASVSADASLRVSGLQPYWMAGGVRNTLDVLPGTPTVLTGPNGGGKSTLLRSVAATAVLAQCGLLVPCDRAHVPSYTHVFLRSGATDCAAERRSSFTSEMCDLKTMMTACGETLVLVDEPCRGTATADGVRLLEAILSHMPSLSTCVCTTHFHELQAPHCEWMQLAARLDDATAECTPEYVLRPGRCTESLALQVALHAGLPVDIVRAARGADDEDTLVLTVLHAMGLRYTRMRSSQTIPASVRTALYVLLTSSGVYCGESDAMASRLDTHRRSKDVRALFLVPVEDKSRARALETKLIHEMLYCDVRVLSVADGSHVVR